MSSDLHTYDQQGHIIGEKTHYVQFGMLKLTLRTAPIVDTTPRLVGSEAGLDMLCCEHCPEEIGRIVWDGSAFRCRCGARYQAKRQQQSTAASTIPVAAVRCEPPASTTHATSRVRPASRRTS